jgi:hypothetical protein
MALTTLDTEIAAHFFSHLAADYDVRPQLSQISCPTLVIVGRHDWICTPAAGVALAQVIPDARLVELPDAGHFEFSERVERCDAQGDAASSIAVGADQLCGGERDPGEGSIAARIDPMPRGVRVRVMEDLERAVAVPDLDDERVAGLGVRDRHRDAVVRLAPQQADVDPVVVAAVELAH